MKRLMIAGAVALATAVSMASCAKSDSTATGTNENPAIADSIATFYGKAFGANIYGYLENQEQRSGKEINKSDVLKGVQYVLGANSSQDFITGMKIGMDMKNFIEESRQNGVEVSADVVMKNFRRILSADSLNTDAAQTDYAEFSALMNRMRILSMEKQKAEKAKQAEEAEKEGRAYVEKMKKADSEIKTSGSGLSYKIENPGEEPKIGPNTTAKVKYTGKLTDGTVFDSGEAEFAPNRVVPGFGEGMQLLGKGGKATLYIPGNLGYGENGAGDKIGPNATLIFDIEIVEVSSEAAE